ncbi:Fur-regulated basic protein FbpA [Aquibacillus saliphilus]|uniref:Fur-regulated basic protein FbpA n=1 Tax=Aquibacillus saliphilus TaxID=1909422 RepID=UPI001CF0CCB2|nr:Fur-regulated basic protein FbpA [Aquibacillus saliphilus]
MAYLREAVQQQKEFLIAQLINQGVAKEEDNDDLSNMTISELINEYDQFKIVTNKSNNNSLRFTRSISWKKNRKPHI